MSDAAITGAKVVIPFVKSDGKVRNVEILPFTDCQIVELDEWCKSNVIRVAALGAIGLPDELQSKILDAAIMRAAKTVYFSPEGQEMMRSREGMQQLIFCSAIPGTITREELRELFRNTTNILLAAKMFDKLNNGNKEPGDNTDDSGQKKVENGSTLN